MSRLIMCTGGARSGKSEFAESLALSLKGQKGYIATSLAYDDEMRDRIAAHQARRGSEWLNYEIPIHMDEQLDRPLQECEVILLDCMTMYIMNVLMDYDDVSDHEVQQQITAQVVDHVDRVLGQLRAFQGTIIIVTNEIGLGIVPMDPLTRLYRDIVGKVNQHTAALADEVYMSISGIPVEIKSLATHSK